MSLTDLKRLIANDNCGLNLFCAREGEVVSRLQPFCFAALKHEWQSVQKSADRKSPIQSIADTLCLLVWKSPRDVFFGVRIGNHINCLFLLLQRLDDILQVGFAIREEQPYHIFARWTDGHTIGSFVIGAK